MDVLEEQPDVVFVYGQAAGCGSASGIRGRGESVLERVADDFFFAAEEVAVDSLVEFLAALDWERVGDGLSSHLTEDV